MRSAPAHTCECPRRRPEMGLWITAKRWRIMLVGILLSVTPLVILAAFVFFELRSHIPRLLMDAHLQSAKLLAGKITSHFEPFEPRYQLSQSLRGQTFAGRGSAARRPADNGAASAESDRKCGAHWPGLHRLAGRDQARRLPRKPGRFGPGFFSPRLVSGRQ